MINQEYEAVVVGAGPAGNIAARYLAQNNIKTLVLDKKQEIGPPKRCAEGINLTGLRRVGLEPNPVWATNKITGAVLYAPSGKPFRVVLENKEGYILERKIFEKHLAMDAIRCGARYMIKTLVTEAITEDGRVCGVKASHMGEEFEVRSKLVIAADGVDSKTAKSAGIDTANSLADYHSGYQYEMAGLKITEPGLMHLYFGDEVAPKGYVWIFPKGADCGNVGIGVLGRLSAPGKKARDYLDAFIEARPEIFGDASPVEVNTGGIPVGSPIDPMVADGFMVVGDAAHQVNPIHGGGMSIAMNAAKIAAEVGAKAIREGDLSKKRLSEYETIWRAGDGAKMEKLLKLRMFLEKLDSGDLETMSNILTSEDVIRLTEGEYGFLAKRFIKKAPKILPIAKKFLSGKDA